MIELGKSVGQELHQLHLDICAEYYIRDKGPVKRLITLKNDELGHPFLKNVPMPFFWGYFGIVKGGEVFFRLGKYGARLLVNLVKWTGSRVIEVAEQIANSKSLNT